MWPLLGLPGGPGVKTPHFKCRDGGSTPCWGTKIPQASGTVQKKKSHIWNAMGTCKYTLTSEAADNRQNTLRDGQRGRSSAPARPRPPTSGSSRPGTGLRAVGEKRRQAIKNLQFDFLLRQPESLAAAATGPREVRLRLKCVCVCVCCSSWTKTAENPDDVVTWTESPAGSAWQLPISVLPGRWKLLRDQFPWPTFQCYIPQS